MQGKFGADAFAVKVGVHHIPGKPCQFFIREVINATRANYNVRFFYYKIILQVLVQVFYKVSFFGLGRV